MAAVRHLRFSYFRNICQKFVKNSNMHLLIRLLQNLVKIRRSSAELLRIFNFQNGGRPPSWIWYDVIPDYPRLVFDGPNIVR